MTLLLLSRTFFLPETMPTRLRFFLLATICSLLLAAVGYEALDRWQRATIFSIELGEGRWWREPPSRTEIFDINLAGNGTVRAWYLAHADPKAPTVLYLHGSRWNLNGSVFRIERWLEMGFSVLAIDYRGFGESSPLLPSQASATEDAIAALHELEQRQPDPSRRYVYGHSLGGAIAVSMAAHTTHPAFAGLILESTFTNIQDMIPTTGYSAIPGLHRLVTQPFDSVGSINQVRSPILFLHGTNDQIVPHTMSDLLFGAARNRTDTIQQLVKIPGASHSGVSRSGSSYEKAIMNFVGLTSSSTNDAARYQAHR
ncbi:alpha/beta hydrolase [Pollutimonas nitritireducens]|nr:alpha/beta fold hydrolase [Pollutimonas nitritireducens]